MINFQKIKEISDEIVSVVHPERIVLFGSYAYGRPTEDSDIDILVVVKESREPRYKRAREIRKHLWGKIDTPKDILVYTVDEVEEWQKVPQSFIANVLSKGKVIYEKQTRTH